MHLFVAVCPLLSSFSARPCPSVLPASSLFASLVTLVAPHARPACGPCSLLRYPCPAALSPLSLPRLLSSTHQPTASQLFVTRRGFACPLLSKNYCLLPLSVLYFLPRTLLVDLTHAILRCPYPFPWRQVVPEGLSPCPTNVGELRVARLRRVAHRASGWAHPWPALAAPSERWLSMRPTAPPPHHRWSPSSEHGAFQGGLPCIGAIMLSFEPDKPDQTSVHAG